MVEPIYLSHMSTDSVDSTDPNIATIVHQACDQLKFFVALRHGVNLPFLRSDSGDLLVVPEAYR